MCITREARKLNDDGTISYHISVDGDGIYLQITPNGSSEGGTSARQPVYLSELFVQIVSVFLKKGYFEREDLRGIPGITGGNNNDPGFVVAILRDIGFVVECGNGQGRYRLRLRNDEAP